MKTIKSLLAVLFLLAGSQAFAQSGTSPYVGAKHIYFVNSSDNGISHEASHDKNKYKWYVATDLDGLVPAAVGDYQVEEVTWDKDNAIENLFSIHITWKIVPSPASPYYIFVEEYSGSGCISKRRIEVNVIPNAFDVTIASATTNTCNDASERVFTGATPDAGQLSTSVRTFAVTMSGTVNEWKFKPVIADNNSAGASATYKHDDGTVKTLTVDVEDYIVVPAGENEVIITVTVNNVWNANSTEISASINDAQDTLYKTLEKDEVDGDTYAAAATSIVLPLPMTTEISTN